MSNYSTKGTVQIKAPAKLAPLFSSNCRYICAYGGRASGKTSTFALLTVITAYRLAEAGATGVILCAREYMSSLRDSSFNEIRKAIQSYPWLASYFKITPNTIATHNGRISFTFTGLRLSLNSIKSTSQILLCWVDEAEPVTEYAWNVLIPTIRTEFRMPDGSLYRSKILVTWNPEVKGSATDKRFRNQEDPDILSVEINYCDNPFLPSVMKGEIERAKRNLDPAIYQWIWLGAYLENSNRQVIKHARVAEFSDTLYEQAECLLFGADFGFADDPATLVRSFIIDSTLYIEYEAYATHVELPDLPRFYSQVPIPQGYQIKADAARPDIIAYLNRQGIPAVAAKKWQGSVMAGITFINSFSKIVIHPRCTNTYNEVVNYCHKVSNAGEVLPDIIDKHNHCWDAIRYSLDKQINPKQSMADIYMRR